MKLKIIAWTLAVCAVLSTAGAAILLFTILNPGYGEAPTSSAPTAVRSATPTTAPLPELTIPARPTPTPTPTPTVDPIADINGLPVHITIHPSGGSGVIDSEIVTMTLDDNGMLVPPAGKAGVYYSSSDWSTLPGNLDRYRGIIVGHDVTGWGGKDVFYHLGEVRAGDTVSVVYKLHDGSLFTAEFVVTADAHSAPKTDVTSGEAYKYLWNADPEAGRYLSILSCDLSKAAPGQHSRNNWIVDTVRTK